MTLISDIKHAIKSQLDKGKKFIIFPYSEVGMQFEYVLRHAFGITAEYILDNHLAQYNSNIKPVSYLKELNTKDYIVFLASTNPKLYEEFMASLEEHVPSENIVVLATMRNHAAEHAVRSQLTTSIGKYSYGPLCRNHPYIKSIGSFCSFAPGVEVVLNHEMGCVTTHPMIYHGQCLEGFDFPMENFWPAEWFFEGVQPHSNVSKTRRCVIGNDVWLGRNVTITNGANIGNGVIAGAGAIITKDVPDYAIVVGAPARIIRYRYSPEQIEALNRIQWWDWTDDEIRERYEDFYLPIEEFIEKYDTMERSI